MRRSLITLASALSLIVAVPAFAQTGADKQPAKEKTDYAAEAQKRADAFVNRKVACFEKAGLEKGKTFRISPEDDTMVQVWDAVWRQPKKYDLAAVRKCADMSQ